MATIRKGTYKFNSTMTQITNQHNLNSALFSFRIDNPDTEVTECTAMFFNFNSETELSDVSYEYSNNSAIAYSKTDGWYPEYQTIIVDETQNVTVNTAEAEDDFWTWFNANAVEVVPEKLSYDLSTSSKWANLSDGSHHVTIVAKADTYRDSNSSIGVDIVKTTSTSETWVLNADTTSVPEATINFISDSQQFTKMGAVSGDPPGIYYYFKADGTKIKVYDSFEGSNWQDPAYRTLTFDTAPSGDLLTWLQANGTKQ